MDDKMSTEESIIDHTNSKNLNDHDLIKLQSKEFWHKIVIKKGASLNKDKVLLSILDSISPIDLVPVKYTINKEDSYFLARNCGPAISKLCDNSLQVSTLPEYDLGIIELNVHLCHIPIDNFKVNMQSHLKKVIEKRLNQCKEGYIDLSDFHREPELSEILFCPLSHPRFLSYVLSILKQSLNVTTIDLSRNNIKNLKPLETLKELEGLKNLDLSFNQIDNPDSLLLIGNTISSLQEINLDGNPLCSLYSTEFSYVQAIIERLPTLKKLDGVNINLGLPNHQTWLCNNEAALVADQFIEHYFSLYDQERWLLQHAYREDAFFSLNVTFLPDYKSSRDAKLQCYENNSRSMLKVNEEIKIMGPVFRKKDEILEILRQLPPTEHDVHSFKVDLLYNEGNAMVLTVSGIFKDLQEKPRIRSFSRNFILCKTAEDEYKISNDLYHVSNVSDDEIESAFTHPKRLKSNKRRKITANIEERKNAIDVVSKLTDMNVKYSKKCLEDVNWNVKKALEVFLDNYTLFKIPPEAFLE